MANPNLILAQIESRHLWAYYHKDWLLEIRRALREQLPAEYHVFVESETILVSPEAHEAAVATMPDVAVARSHESAPGAAQEQPTSTAAVVEIDEPLEIVSKYSLLIRRSSENHVVAALEILSPSNKGLGNRFDREKYLRKRDSYLEAGINFLEIDALRSGDRVLPDSLQKLAKFERTAWTALHVEGLRRFRGWGWNDDDPLPDIAWSVENGLRVIVDLGKSANDAFAFNRWESLVG